MPPNQVYIVSGWGGRAPEIKNPVGQNYDKVAGEKLLAFFRSEFLAEERSGFARLKRVPDSHVAESLGWYQSLSNSDKANFVDYSAHHALSRYGFVALALRPDIKKLIEIGTPQAMRSAEEEICKASFDHTKHPFFSRWRDVLVRFPFRSNRNVPILRSSVSQHKIDRHRGVPSFVSEEDFRFAESVKSIKAPELRKRILATLKKFGYQKTDKFAGHRCVWNGQDFEVSADLGSRSAQLRYSVLPTEFRALHPFGQFCYEEMLGMGLGWWNFTVEENVDDVFLLFEELIKYAADLPNRIRAAAAAADNC